MTDASAQPAWTALVVEDEPRLRAALVALLHQAAPGWREVLEAGDAESARQLADRFQPEIAFLDIRLPGQSGLELAAQLPPETRVVFTTAYDAHALEAFDKGAVDYLLKPVTLERLERTLARVRARESQGPMAELRRPPEAAPEPLEWVLAHAGRRTHWIPVEEVLCFQSDSKWTKVVCAEQSHLIELSLKELAARLDPKRFVQVHRSAIVNLKAIAWLERLDGEGGRLHLKGCESPLPVSAAGLKALKGR